MEGAEELAADCAVLAADCVVAALCAASAAGDPGATASACKLREGVLEVTRFECVGVESELRPVVAGYVPGMVGELAVDTAGSGDSVAGEAGKGGVGGAGADGAGLGGFEGLGCSLVSVELAKLAGTMCPGGTVVVVVVGGSLIESAVLASGSEAMDLVAAAKLAVSTVT